MKDSDIDKAMQAKLDRYRFKLSDLTDDEVDKLREEVEAEMNGMQIIDGVLFHIPPYRLKK